MYRKNDPYQMQFEDFYLPFGGKLRSDNRWVILSKQIPWQEIEQAYAENFEGSDTGTVAKPGVPDLTPDLECRITWRPAALP